MRDAEGREGGSHPGPALDSSVDPFPTSAQTYPRNFLKYNIASERPNQPLVMGGPPQYDPVHLGDTPFSLQRPVRDRGWAVAFAVLYLGCFIGNVLMYQSINPKFFQLDEAYLNDPAHCPVHQGRKLLEAGSDGSKPRFDAQDFLSHATGWLLISMALSLALAAGFLYLVRHHAFSLSRATIGFQLAIPTVAAVGLLAAGQLGQSLLLAALAALTYFVFYIWRREIGVASKLLSVAGHGLTSNSGLIGLVIVLNFLAVLFAIPPMFGVLVGLANGDVVPNPERAGQEACINDAGASVICCVWEPTSNGMAFLAASGTLAAWTMLTLNQIRVFVVSGTIAQWYFSPSGTSTRGNAGRSLKHAVTSSFGSNIFAGLVLTITNAFKQENQQQQQEGNFSLFGLLGSYVIWMFEYLTKFATVFAAITGEALLPAGRQVTQLLTRNLLDAFATTIWFPSLVVGLASFTMSALWGVAVWASYRYLHAQSGELYPASNAVALGILAGAISMFVLSFLSGVLLSVLDAVFVCFAIDRDRHAVANAEMYEALLGVAEERGVVVESPDGELGYGATADTYQGTYRPPTTGEP